MNRRERYLETLTFGRPDKIPFAPGGPRESTLARWRTEGLPEDGDWKQHIRDAVGVPAEAEPARASVPFYWDLLPRFEEKVLEHKNGHYIVQDYKGNICEISDQYDVTYLQTAKDFVTRRWIKCPVETRDDWEQIKERFDVDAPGRMRDDFAEQCQRLSEADTAVGLHINGPFWQMREWCGFEGLCMMMIEQPDLVHDMADFWRQYISAVLERVLAAVRLDWVHYSEDMAYKEKAMISPAMCREFLMPCWTQWSRQVRQAGARVVDMDSDGYVGELIPLWIESGINVCDPMEVAAGNDLNEFRRQFGRNMAYTGGVDKRCIAKGGQVIRDELARLEPVVKGGGYIPGCDHGVPSDISYPDFIDYSKRIGRMTGWL